MNSPQSRPATTHIAFLGVAQILVWGGSFFLMAVLADPVVADTGWPREWVYGALSVGILVSGVLAPGASRLISRFGGRTMLACSGWIIGAGLVLVALSPSLPVFILAWSVIGLGMTAGLYEALFASLGHLYGSQARNAIIGVTLVAGLSTTITWPLVAALIEHLGWRLTCLVYAGVLAVSIWPLSMAGLPGSQQLPVPPQEESRIGRASQPRLFYLIMLIFSLGATIMTAMSVHLLALLQGNGYSLATAIGFSAIIGPCQVLARILDILSRNSNAARSTLVSGLLTAVGLLLVALAPQVVLLGILLYGVGNGLRALVRGTLPLMIWSAAEYPLVMGRMARPALLCQAATPFLGGYLMELVGARYTLYCLCGIATLNAGLVVLLWFELKRWSAR
ncbi:MFS transporter [Pseudomonas sp. BN414]|nr:MFS transporter [Pseudomonas sp. BN414]MDH4567049.1 MFS transporter [Pseudomonas sp. BN414]